MEVSKARSLLERGGFEIKSEERLSNNTGTQLRLKNGAIVNIFDNGNFNVQGKNKAQVEDALRKAAGVPESPVSSPVKRKVFVVYGHDQTSRDQLEAMLRRWGLELLILDQLPTEGQTVIEKLEAAIAEASFGVVLATPDDEGYRANRPDEKAYRARQNVVLELGMLLANLGRQNVAILLKTQENMERPSDIQGLIYVPFKDDIAKEAGVSLAKTMSARGYQIDVKKL
ncbi:MAG: nucleotide-binding protein [Desulfobacteraceae bacterium]|nr:nucleotide-binding protein [Desulfobacteraceae bacterium]